MNMARLGERPRGTFVCSTDAVAAADRGDYFRDATNRIYPGLTIDWPAEPPARAWLESFPFAAAQVTRFCSSANSAANRPGIHPSGRYHLVVHLAGDARYVHAGREIVHQPGDMMLIDTDRSFEGDYPSGLRILVWELPQELLVPLLAEPEQAVGRLIPGLHGPGAVLSNYARTISREAANVDARERRTFVHHLCSLIALALGSVTPVREACHLSYRSALRQRVLSYIEAHFRDSGLSATHAASDLKLSRRWLYDLLDDEEFGFAARVSRRRIEECLKLLADPTHDHLSVTEIAFRCGFGELSTFNRRFRAQCGMTPREFRRNRSQIADNAQRSDSRHRAAAQGVASSFGRAASPRI